MGLGSTFGFVRTYSPVVLHRHDNSVVGVTSIINIRNGTNRYGCTTSGTNVVTLTGSVTRRLNPGNMHTGTMTPNFVRATVATRLPRRVHGS